MNSPLKLVCVTLLCLTSLWSCTEHAASPGQDEPPPKWIEDKGSSDQRPDIVLVVADDMRWDLMSSRDHEFLHTPMLDRLATDGAMMMNAFVPVAVCSQSRAAILTGRDVHKASAPVMVRKNNSFLQTQKTFASYLQEAGYTTAFLGKWHLGEGSKPKAGFDHWESFDWLGDFHDPVIHRNGVPVAHKGYVDDILSRRASRVLYENRESGKPMLLMVSLKAPHLQFEHPARHAHAMQHETIPKPDTYYEDYSVSGKPLGIFDWLSIENHRCGIKCFANSWQKFIKYHFRAVLGLDDQVGVLRDAIAKGGKPDNTLFIFTSDNGYSLGDHGLSAKHFVYEEPVRVPFLVDAPGDSEAGLRPGVLVSTVDIAPTILDYAETPIPPTMSGRSLKPLLENDVNEPPWRDELFFMYEKERNTVPTQIAVRTDRYKLIRSELDTIQYELYDLESDPKETVTHYSDPAYVDVRDAMKVRLNALVARNQWSPRKTFSVNKALISNPVASSVALVLGRELSGLPVESGRSISNAQGTVTWREVSTGNGESPDRFQLKDNLSSTDGQSVLVVLPLTRLISWDPFVEVLVGSKTHATVFANGQELFSTKRSNLPGDVINPPMISDNEQVMIVFEDTGEMSVKLNLTVAEDTLRLPLENRTLGDAPGRFLAVDGWQPHQSVSLRADNGTLEIAVEDDKATLQTDALYLNQAVTIELEATAESPLPASLYWRSEQGEWSTSAKSDFQIGTIGGVKQVFEIDPTLPVEALKIEFLANDVKVRIDKIEVFSESGETLYQWEFAGL